MIDLKSEEGARDFFKFCAHLCKKDMEATGGITPTAHLLITVHPETGVLLEQPDQMILPYFGEFTEESKTGLAKLVRKLAKDLKAIAVVFCSEAWLLQAPKEEYEKYKKLAGKKGLENHPHRKEICQIYAEHVAIPGCTTMFAEIKEDGDKRTLAEFSEERLEKSSGRFTNFLDRPN